MKGYLHLNISVQASKKAGKVVRSVPTTSKEYGVLSVVSKKKVVSLQIL